MSNFNPGYVAFKLAFNVSPIILKDGIAANIPGSMLPIIAITESLNFVNGLLSTGGDIGLDDFFAYYEPLPGSSLIAQDVGKYTFANQAVAANAVIAQPLEISLLMHCPVRDEFGYAVKLATMMALQAQLAKHNASGGTYIIATPSFFYTDCLLLNLRDASNGDSKQRQNAYRWDFYKPLLTIAQAQQAQSSLMSKLSNGQAVPADASGGVTWSGLSPSVGSASTLAGTSVVPATNPAPASSALGLGAS